MPRLSTFGETQRARGNTPSGKEAHDFLATGNSCVRVGDCAVIPPSDDDLIGNQNRVDDRFVVSSAHWISYRFQLPWIGASPGEQVDDLGRAVTPALRETYDTIERAVRERGVRMGRIQHAPDDTRLRASPDPRQPIPVATVTIKRCRGPALGSHGYIYDQAIRVIAHRRVRCCRQALRPACSKGH